MAEVTIYATASTGGRMERVSYTSYADLTALAAANSAHGDNQGYHCGNALYRIDWPDAAFDGGAGKKVILVVVCTGCDTIYREIELSPPVDVIAISGRDGVNCYILVTGCDVDVSHTYQAVSVQQQDSRMFNFQRLHGARLADCTFNTGSNTHALYNAGWAEASYPQSWVGCTGNDFSGSTITGYVRWGNFWPYGIPSTIVGGYWDPEANPDNIWPAVV